MSFWYMNVTITLRHPVEDKSSSFGINLLVDATWWLKDNSWPLCHRLHETTRASHVNSTRCSKNKLSCIEQIELALYPSTPYVAATGSLLQRHYG